MQTTKHRRLGTGSYSLTIETPVGDEAEALALGELGASFSGASTVVDGDSAAVTFEYPAPIPDPETGVTPSAAKWEEMQVRESALLIRSALNKANADPDEGVVLAAEGKKIPPIKPPSK